MPLGRKKRGWMTRSLGFSSSDSGVWSSANSLTAAAPTRLSSTPRTLMVRVMSPVFAWIKSFAFTSREGFTFCPATSTWPLRQAAEARLRVLKILTAQSHLSILMVFRLGKRSWGAHPPRVWLDAPRVQHFRARPLADSCELFGAPDVFREGAENGTRGACAPDSTSVFGLNGSVLCQPDQEPRT